MSPLAPCWRSQLLFKALSELYIDFSCCKIWLSYKSNIIASSMYLHKCWHFPAHLRMCLQHLTALCSAQREFGSFLNYLWVLVRLTRLSGWLACIFQTILHLADKLSGQFALYRMYPISMIRLLDSVSSALEWYICDSIVKIAIRILCTNCDI